MYRDGKCSVSKRRGRKCYRGGRGGRAEYTGGGEGKEKEEEGQSIHGGEVKEGESERVL